MIEKLLKIHEKDIDFSIYFKLLICKDQATYRFPKLDFNVLKILGLIDFNCNVTKKGDKILKDCVIEDNDTLKTENSYTALHKKLQDELVRLTGKKQVKANGSYTFLCNNVDLENKISKIIKKYKLKDWNKIEKLLLLHVNKAKKQNFDKVMLIQYYIEKNGNSTLASDYENFEELEIVKENKTQIFDI